MHKAKVVAKQKTKQNRNAMAGNGNLNFDLEGQEQKIKGTACLHVLFAPKDENCIKKIEISGNFPICQAYMR